MFNQIKPGDKLTLRNGLRKTVRCVSPAKDTEDNKIYTVTMADGSGALYAIVYDEQGKPVDTWAKRLGFHISSYLLMKVIKDVA